MSADNDRIDQAQADARNAATNTADRARNAEQNAKQKVEQKVEHPAADRELARPRPDGQLADTAGGDRTALFEPAVLSEFNTRWTDVQTSFVDEPRRAVQQADALVSDVIQRIADSFGAERNQLEQQWDRGGDVSTEELRQALQRYRSFFSRLLTL
jgi:hypothetical protein